MSLKRFFKISNVNRLRIRTILFIGVFWTAIDLVIVMLRVDEEQHRHGLLFREILIFIVSLIMGYIFVYRLKKMLRHLPLWLNFLAKSFILLIAALVIVFLFQFVNNITFQNMSVHDSYHYLQDYALYKDWLLRKVVYWLAIFFVTQLILIINEKYSPGVFLDILTGKYINPREETRIVMFIDLKDSTPIAEKLGHHNYFEFIRDFIYLISQAVIEFDGTIYQYVGDEVVSSWMCSDKNARKCLNTIIQSRKNIQRKSEVFRRKYGIVPEFRVGIHAGEVTVGEIGVIKKDLAMSGDTMNTTARIRSACNELKHHFVASKEFVELGNLKDFQIEDLGMVDLKGKDRKLQLFNLKI
jgi:adenylate cyclase